LLAIVLAVRLPTIGPPPGEPAGES
jgi:hypothetical protein